MADAVIMINFLTVNSILSPLCSACKHHFLTQSLSPFPPQMERPGPAGGVAEPLCGAHVPAQYHYRQPSPHRASGQSPEPAARASGPTASHAQTQSAPAQWYAYQSTKTQHDVLT